MGILLMSVTAAVAVAASPASALSPSVETTGASGIGETGATLNGKVNPNGLETKYFFEYGTTASYGTKTAEVSAGSGNIAVELGQSIGGLTKSTVYHYRVVAKNSSGTSQGADQTFTTAGPPEVTSVSATVESNGEAATLKAWVDPNGQNTTYQFKYSSKGEGGSGTVPIPAESAGSEFSGSYVTYKLTGLTKGEEYYWQATASNAGGSASGSWLTFLSSPAPAIDYNPVVDSSRSAATLEAFVEPHGLNSKYYFEYGPTTSYGSKTAVGEVSSEVERKLVKQPLSGLAANTVYHYRMVAENNFLGARVHVGKDQTLTTSDTATLYLQEGAQISAGTQLNVVGSFEGTAGGGTASCNEVQFGGKLTENPGALQAVETPKLHDGGNTTCKFSSPGYAIDYAFPASGITLDYGTVGAEDGSVRTNSFVFTETGYLGEGVIYECEKKISLHGDFELETNLILTLFGEAETLKGGVLCQANPYASFELGVTSGGQWVEAKP